MKAIKFCLFTFALGMIACQSASAQDYIGYVEQLAAQAGQRAEMHAMNAINIYRQETGDYQTSDQQVWAYLDAMARQQNPGFYADLQARENAFQMQQAQYRQYANSMLDNSYNSYMNRSNMQHQGHQNYIQQGIWERGDYSWNGSTYELPNYDPGFHEAYDGTTFYQDDYGDYYYWGG
ncbi:MAG: hypothetical protein AAF456_10915 [Planctomycetota bacterium]